RGCTFYDRGSSKVRENPDSGELNSQTVSIASTVATMDRAWSRRGRCLLSGRETPGIARVERPIMELMLRDVERCGLFQWVRVPPGSLSRSSGKLWEGRQR